MKYVLVSAQRWTKNTFVQTGQRALIVKFCWGSHEAELPPKLILRRAIGVTNGKTLEYSWSLSNPIYILSPDKFWLSTPPIGSGTGWLPVVMEMRNNASTFLNFDSDKPPAVHFPALLFTIFSHIPPGIHYALPYFATNIRVLSRVYINLWFLGSWIFSRGRKVLTIFPVRLKKESGREKEVSGMDINI